MPTYTYKAREDAPRGNCPVCRAWDGRTSQNRGDLPAVPNPACLSGVARCHCQVLESEGDGDDDLVDRGHGRRGDGVPDDPDGRGGGDIKIKWDADWYEDWWYFLYK